MAAIRRAPPGAGGGLAWSRDSRYQRPIPETQRPRGQIPMAQNCRSPDPRSPWPPAPAFAVPAAASTPLRAAEAAAPAPTDAATPTGPAAAPAWRTIAFWPPPDPPIILTVPAIRLPIYVIRPGPLICEAAAAACSVAAGTCLSAIGKANDPSNRNATAKNSVVMSPLIEPLTESRVLFRSAAARTINMVITNWERMVATIRSMSFLIQCAVAAPIQPAERQGDGEHLEVKECSA